jgi:hypothetical protein
MAVAATGALSFNTINNDIQATIDDTTAPGTTSVKSKDTLNLIATDEARIDATAVAASASLTGSRSGSSVSIGIGASLASNTISRNTRAELANFDPGLASGDLVVRSANNSTINSRSIAATFSATVGNGFSAGLTGGGASSFNTITGNNQALITNANLGSGLPSWNGSVTVTATDTSFINAKVDAISVDVAAGSTGLAASIGVSIARNFIGATQGNAVASGGDPTMANNGDGNRISATISGATGNPFSTLTSGGAIRVEASHNATIKAEVVAVSAAIAAVGGGGDVALSGAGSEATNLIATSTTATISGNSAAGSSSILASTDLTISANDTASIDATAVGASLAASFSGSAAVAPSIGISLATNTIRRNTKAELATDFSKASKRERALANSSASFCSVCCLSRMAASTMRLASVVASLSFVWP